MSDIDPRLKTLVEIEWEVRRVQEDFEQRNAQADLVPVEERDEAWKEARERRYIQYLEDMKILAAEYASMKMRSVAERLN